MQMIRRLLGKALGYEAEAARQERTISRLRTALQFYRDAPRPVGTLGDVAEAAYHATLAAIPVGSDCTVEIETIERGCVRFAIFTTRRRGDLRVVR